MRKTFFAFILLAFCTVLAAQQSLNNASVAKLCKAGLSDDLVVATINASPGTYDTSADAIIALKSAGASDRVVAAVVVKSSAPAPAAAPVQPAVAAASDPDDPNAPHEAGIYAYSEKAPAGHKMIMLEPSVYSAGKTGGVFASAMTYGIAKVKIKAVIRGAHSNARISDPQSTFYFYFENQGAGLSNASSSFWGGTSTPNEYVILRFDVKESTRETITGKFNAFGASGGTDDKAVVPFSYNKLRPGVYKVTLNMPLPTGEYGFVAPSGFSASPVGGAIGSASHVFDFGVN